MAPALLLLIGPVELIGLSLAGAVWLCWALSAAYLLVLALCAVFARRAGRPEAEEKRRICVLIPAHDEELLLGPVIDRLGELEYPRSAYQVVVIADNCSDGTARVARERGARVLERTDAGRRGKGYALAWALERLLVDPGRFDAFLILDADSVLSPNYLQVMNSALAGGHLAIQGRYDVLNTDEGWRTRLMACALALAHYVRPLGRNRLGLSDGLKGNGMCFAREVLERLAWSGESITEDIDYTIRLVRAGVRIEFAPEAVVRAQMPTTGRQAATQRQRWEGGRYALLGRALRLMAEGVRARQPMVIDRAAELIIPPFVELSVVTIACLLGSAAWWAASGATAAGLMLLGWGGVLAMEGAYLAIGLALARVPWTVAVSLLFAPIYIAWKFGLYALMLLGRGAGGWNRTERKQL